MAKAVMPERLGVKDIPSSTVPFRAHEPPGWPATFARIAAAAAIAVAAVVLLGWLIDADSLKRFLPGAVDMKTNAAVGVVMAGVAVLLKVGDLSHRRRLVGDGLGLVCVVLGLVTLAEYVTGWQPGIDEQLFSESLTAVRTSSPNRMAASVAMSLVLLGAAVVLTGRGRRRTAAAQCLAGLVGMLAALALVGYGYGSLLLYQWRRSTAAAIPAGIALLLLGAAVVVAARGPPISLLTSQRPGGMLARRVLPLIVVIPLGAGWLLHVAGQRGWADPALQTALGSLTTVALLTLLTLGTALGLERADAARAAAEAPLRLALQTTPIGAAILDLDGRFVEVNDAMCQIFGIDAATLATMTSWDVSHPDEVAADRERFARLVRGETATTVTEERYVRADGDICWLLVARALVRDDSDAAAYVISQAQDITDAKRIQDRLVHQASHDQLTGLPNRVLLLDRLHHALARSARTGYSVALMFCDLDHFKVINDSLGHEAGDRVLLTVADRMTSAVRTSDTVARVGGDEFVVLAEDIDLAYAAALANRIRLGVRQPLDVNHRQLLPTVSVGVALGEGARGIGAGDLLRDADYALYRAKERGRDSVEMFEEALRQRAVESFEVESELRAAVAADALALHYQPIIDLDAGRVTGYEALLRWPRGADTTWTPDKFLHVAEETGLIIPIGDWVLDRAAAFAAARPDAFVSVNLSVRQLYHPQLIEHVQGVLARHDLRPDRLHLELVESALIGPGGAALATLRGLHDIGVRFAVDDFGTGYSALSYLHDLPVAELKIDRSFTGRIGLGTGAERIIEALIVLGRTLGLDVVAEGVETRDQAEWLVRRHCPKAQGFYYGRPAPAPADARDSVA